MGLKALRRTAAMSVALLAAMTLATLARAACGLTAQSVGAAQAVFVGLLTDVSADGTNATFEVQEVWRGGGLVAGKGVGIDTTNSLQRLELPPPDAPLPLYLVLANTVDGQLHTGDSCELFPFPWDPSYADFRPAGVPPPDASPASDAAFPVAALALGAALLVLAVVGVVAFRRGPAGDG